MLPVGSPGIASATASTTCARSLPVSSVVNTGFLTDIESYHATATLSFSYGADRSRFRQVNSASGVTTLYIDGLFEQRTAGSTATQVHYIHALGRAVAVYTAAGSSVSTRYLHGGHLGSVVLLTDEGGNVEGNRYAFDAFGRRRNATTWGDSLTALDNPDTTVGFTGHESLDAVDLVHMNGRVYDPFLGRVLSPDPYVQAPFEPQNLNRYAYVLNNPLSFTDPSGFNYSGDFGFGMWVWAENFDLDRGCVSCRVARAMADHLGRLFDRELRRSLGGGSDGSSSGGTRSGSNGDTVRVDNASQANVAKNIMGSGPIAEAHYRNFRRGYVEYMKSVNGFTDAVKEIVSVRAGVGYGFRIKEIKIGPARAGVGIVAGAGGIGLDSRNISSWGESTADARLSFGDSGGRIYLWDIAVDSAEGSRVNLGPGYDAPSWNWSFGIEGTVSPFSAGIELNFQPLLDYLNDENPE